MAFIMVKTRQFLALAFSLHAMRLPVGRVVIALLPQQPVQQNANLRHRHGRGVFFSPDAIPASGTTPR
jgi:hypothetical protein